MQSRRTYLILIALSAVLVLDGCAWTKRTWNRVWGRDTEEAQQEATAQAEQDPSIVTGAEGDIPSPGQPATSAAGEQVPGMPETQAPTPRAPAPAPAGELPSATSTPAPTASAPAATDMQKPGDDMAMAEPKGQVVTLQADSTFAFGKSDLTAAGKKKLDDLAARIDGMDKAALGTVTVIGHADRIGQPERNQALSERRAEAVKTYLAGQGVNEAMIQTEGRGSSEPVVSCPGDKASKKLISCLAPNRRVEVLINAR
jgi:outer membrane protein OmpA-like peptidoglycan-associated protein